MLHVDQEQDESIRICGAKGSHVGIVGCNSEGGKLEDIVETHAAGCNGDEDDHCARRALVHVAEQAIEGHCQKDKDGRLKEVGDHAEANETRVCDDIRKWLNELGASTLFIERGSPWENGYVESFNGKMRDELLNGEIFYTLQEAKVLIEGWRKEYNQIRPHSALGYRPPGPEVRQAKMLAAPLVGSMGVTLR